MDIRLVTISGTHVPDEIAVELQDSYESLMLVPSNVWATVDFDSGEEAKAFSRQVTAWARNNGHSGKVKETFKNGEEWPTTVHYRLWDPEPKS